MALRTFTSTKIGQSGSRPGAGHAGQLRTPDCIQIRPLAAPPGGKKWECQNGKWVIVPIKSSITPVAIGPPIVNQTVEDRPSSTSPTQLAPPREEPARPLATPEDAEAKQEARLKEAVKDSRREDAPVLVETRWSEPSTPSENVLAPNQLQAEAIGAGGPEKRGETLYDFSPTPAGLKKTLPWILLGVLVAHLTKRGGG